MSNDIDTRAIGAPGDPDEHDEPSPPLAIVTGAAHGIGLAIALALGRDGYRLVAVDNESDALDVADLPPGTARVLHDVAEGPGPIVDRATALGGALHVLVNNVGVMDGRSFLDLPMEAAEHTIRTNLIGPWDLTREVVQTMVTRGGGGTVVFNLSLHSARVRMCPDYSVTKAGLRMLVNELAAELGTWGIRVNAVTPGVIDTWSDRIPDAPEHRARSERLVPLGRLGAGEDVASVVSFLCDDSRSGYITGADIKIDGGLDQFNWLHHLYGSASAEAERVTPE
jgi:NAD(P)-dependent dehydrogenase (short-subunit alcohol dehydrogenase family)